MKPVLKIWLLFALFVFVFGSTAYLALKLIVRSEDVVVVPELVGKDAVYAVEILTDLGLNIKVEGFEYRAGVPKNHVVYQEPKAGAEIKKDRDVRIIVSKGPESVVVPNLVGTDVRQANIIMEENGLTAGAVSKTFRRRIVMSEVISQTPQPGRVVARGDAVDLLISLGRRPVAYKMPYLDGLTPEDAILLLERSHLGLGQIRSVKRDHLPKGVVVEQHPLAGYPVASGSTVNLTVNRAESARIFDKGLYLFHHRVSYGFLKKHVRLRINAFGMFYDLYSVFESPGEEIWMLVPKDPETTFFFYQDGELVLSRSFLSRSDAPLFPELEIEDL
ncbi:MAG: PASTA domain-containing protein [Desulfobacterales bacterium]|nr:PASTA domain-containing protein [Desulfobacterales bacterium]